MSGIHPSIPCGVCFGIIGCHDNICSQNSVLILAFWDMRIINTIIYRHRVDGSVSANMLAPFSHSCTNNEI